MNFENPLENKDNQIGDLEEEKKARIKQIRQEVDDTVDKLGKGIDKGIKDVIVFLNALKVNTTQSCEGHLNSGIGGPYIDIESKDIPELEERLKEVKSEKENEKILEKIELKNLEERKKIINYLDEFYKERNTPYGSRIIINPMGWERSRLENQGVGLQKIELDEIKKENLAEYQKEMADFTEFLEERYFQEPSKF